MGEDVGSSKLTAASVVAAADVVLKEQPAACESPTLTRQQSASSEVNLESIVAATKSALPDGWQDEVRADLEAQLEAGATLYDFLEDGTIIARTKSGNRVVPRVFDDNS